MTEDGIMGRIEGSGRMIDAGLFARYAEMDPERWRQLVGQQVVPSDPRLGTAQVEDVRWGSCCDHVSPYLQVRVRHAMHGVVTFRACSFSDHHRSVAVPEEIRELIHACFERAMTPDEREAVLTEHSRALREASDRRRVERANDLKRRAIDRKGAKASPRT